MKVKTDYDECAELVRPLENLIDLLVFTVPFLVNLISWTAIMSMLFVVLYRCLFRLKRSAIIRGKCYVLITACFYKEK